MKHSLSVIIITKNEEDRIERCLISVKSLADEIIVYDSGSEDKTVDIVKTFTDKIWQTDWPGYGKQKQRALDQASCDWVLSIDADEELDDKMQNAIKNILQQESIQEVAFKLPWANFIFGERTKFGRAGRAPLRLFKRDGAKFTLDMVHEKVVVSGTISKIKTGFLNHYSIRDYEHLLSKTRKYSWLTSLKYFKKKKKSYGIPIAILRSIITFLQIYIIRLGFLDGNRGLILALIFTQSTFNKYVGLWSLEQSARKKANPYMNLDN